QEAFGILLLKLPAVESPPCRLCGSKHTDLAAEAIKPEFAVVVEEVRGILALIHLRQIVFAQAEFIQRDSSAIEISENCRRVLVVYFEVDAAVPPHAAQFSPVSSASLVSIAPVDCKVDVREIGSSPRDGKRIAYASFGDFQVGQILLGWARIWFSVEKHIFSGRGPTAVLSVIPPSRAVRV